MFKFNVQSKKNINELIKQVSDGIKANGGVFNGDVKSGFFSAMGIKGTYKVQDNIIKIEITKKPWILTENLIKTKVRDVFLNLVQI